MLLLLLACDPGPIVLGEPGDGVSTDTAGIGDTADTDTDTDTAGDTDTDPLPEGDYLGEIEGIYRWQDWGGEQTSDCAGDASFTIAVDGTLLGEARCESERWAFDGSVVGSVHDGVVDAAWTVSFGWESVALGMQGTLADGVLQLLVDQELGGGTAFEADVEGLRR